MKKYFRLTWFVLGIVLLATSTYLSFIGNKEESLSFLVMAVLAGIYEIRSKQEEK